MRNILYFLKEKKSSIEEGKQTQSELLFPFIDPFHSNDA